MPTGVKSEHGFGNLSIRGSLSIPDSAGTGIHRGPDGKAGVRDFVLCSLTGGRGQAPTASRSQVPQWLIGCGFAHCKRLLTRSLRGRGRESGPESPSPRVPGGGEGHYCDTTPVEDRESPGEHSAGGFAMLEVGAFSWNGTWPLRVAGGRDCSASEAHQPLSRHLPEGDIQSCHSGYAQ